MRDPKRIQTFCNQLAEHWAKVPDWRFGQLLANVFGAELKKDIFFPEDDEVMGYFDHYFSEYHDPSEIVNNHVDLSAR